MRSPRTALRRGSHRPVPLHDFLALHREIDLALDTFPYNGGATSCHSLWMGVPFATLAGDRYMARMGLSLLEQVGLGEFVARTPDEYVELAVRVGRDQGRLGALRASLRDRVASSPLVDARVVTSRARTGRCGARGARIRPRFRGEPDATTRTDGQHEPHSRGFSARRSKQRGAASGDSARRDRAPLRGSPRAACRIAAGGGGYLEVKK
jgi:hypothetical protein